jgi:hypothetical protein
MRATNNFSIRQDANGFTLEREFHWKETEKDWFFTTTCLYTRWDKVAGPFPSIEAAKEAAWANGYVVYHEL